MVDISNPSGFSKFWDDVVTAFREVAIDNPLSSGNLNDGSPIFNTHFTGIVDFQTSPSQFNPPVVWSIPQTWTPAYETVASDQGALQIMVVVLQQDQDQERAYDEARELGARIVNNVEDDRSLTGASTDAAADVDVWLTEFQMDFLAGGQEVRAQVAWNQAVYRIDAKRLY